MIGLAVGKEMVPHQLTPRFNIGVYVGKAFSLFNFYWCKGRFGVKFIKEIQSEVKIFPVDFRM